MSDMAAVADRTVALEVMILGREFKVSCKESERAELAEAVALLDKRMREIRDSGKIASIERIAVMAALNFANDLLQERKHSRSANASPVNASTIDADASRRRINAMQTAIDQLLAGQEKLL
ncbi:MAG TPA: cell division protein ZapA [Casimicrobiaceae bacterium]|nr:cell division protein ZapA [Casimicrobiaceae bacterium]